MRKQGLGTQGWALLSPDIAEMVKKPPGSRDPWVDNTCPELLKALDVDSATISGPVPDWQTGAVISLFKKTDGGCVLTFQPPWQGLFSSTGEEGATEIRTFDSRGAMCFLTLTRDCGPTLHPQQGTQGCMPNQSTCVLRTIRRHFTVSLWESMRVLQEYGVLGP